MPDNEQLILLTVAQAARRCQVRLTKMYELVASGRVPSVRLGPRCIRIPVAGLERWALQEAGMSEEGRTA